MKYYTIICSKNSKKYEIKKQKNKHKNWYIIKDINPDLSNVRIVSQK